MLEHVKQDAETFAAWGVDMLKLDGCYSSAEEQAKGKSSSGFGIPPPAAGLGQLALCSNTQPASFSLVSPIASVGKRGGSLCALELGVRKEARLAWYSPC